MAYADCSIIALLNDDPRLCDCNKIVAADDIPLSTGQPDKQREISIKADWKYVGEVAYHFSDSFKLFQAANIPSPGYFTPQQFSQTVFHPPQV